MLGCCSICLVRLEGAYFKRKIGNPNKLNSREAQLSSVLPLHGSVSNLGLTGFLLPEDDMEHEMDVTMGFVELAAVAATLHRARVVGA